MFNKFLIIAFTAFLVLNAACSSTETNNSNVNTNVNLAIDPANIPPEFSNKPIDLNGNMPPGIPDPNNANASRPSKGATPTPGIPADPGKPLPKGATPTPGIPDQDTLKKQMRGNNPPQPTKPANDKSADSNRNL